MDSEVRALRRERISWSSGESKELSVVVAEGAIMEVRVDTEEDFGRTSKAHKEFGWDKGFRS